MSTLKLPQVRVLKALCKGSPLLTRAKLSERCGYSSLSGTVTRALDGLATDCKSGAAHLGLIGLGMVACEEIEIEEGLREVAFKATKEGRVALEKYIDEHGEPPPPRDALSCSNKRYAKEDTCR